MKSPSFLPPRDPARSNLMRRVRQHGTNAENQVAGVLRELGIFYRRNVRSLPGSPDFANMSRCWAVFVNGCFWHAHGCGIGRAPKTRLDFWEPKLERTRQRDRSSRRRLRAQGWGVMTVWQCEVRDLDKLAQKLKRFLGRVKKNPIDNSRRKR